MGPTVGIGDSGGAEERERRLKRGGLIPRPSAGPRLATPAPTPQPVVISRERGKTSERTKLKFLPPGCTGAKEK